MTAALNITRKDLQILQLACMDLLHPPRKKAEKCDLMHHIRKMGYLQIDTMQAVARSPYLALWSHLGSYPPEWLDELLAEHQLFEFLAHVLCFIPMEEFPVYRGLNLAGELPSRTWTPDPTPYFPEIEAEIMEIIRTQGPQCSADFNERTYPDEYRNTWGGSKPEKHVMDRLFWRMELMIAYRRKFRRYYDLRERVLPDWDDTQALAPEAARRHMIFTAIRQLGAASPAWARNYYYFGNQSYPDTLFRQEMERGNLIGVQVEDWQESFYMHPDHYELLREIQNNQHQPDFTTFLSPFDPLLSDRRRLLQMFDFDYRLESYTPADKRVYGYFCLPILHQGQLIGRMDAKAWRREKKMEIKAFHLEEGVTLGRQDVMLLRERLDDFTQWHNVEEWSITNANPSEAGLALIG